MTPQTQTISQTTAATTDQEVAEARARLELAVTEMRYSDEGAARQMEQGLTAFLGSLVRSGRSDLDLGHVGVMINEIDERLARQVGRIQHAPQLQAIEARWRELKQLVDATDGQRGVQVEFLDVTKDELALDFRNAPHLYKSSLYRMVHDKGTGAYGGVPYGLVCSSYEFDAGNRDVELLGHCARVAAEAHAPFLANAGPGMFGCEDYAALGQLKASMAQLFEGAQYQKFNGLRDREEARYVALCLPRVLLRAPYEAGDPAASQFAYTEASEGHHDRYLWGAASVALAGRAIHSFLEHGWCNRIVGPSGGGQIDNLPVHTSRTMVDGRKAPVEVALTMRSATELADAGFVPLEVHQNADKACFFSANSIKRTKTFGNSPEGRQKEANARLGGQLPYLMMVCRVGHYLKYMQNERVGTLKSKERLQDEMQTWLMQYVVDVDDPSERMLAERPLRKANVTVADIEGQPGWYRFNVEINPHFVYVGADITLSLVSKLSKAT